jgi:hypothetical protein
MVSSFLATGKARPQVIGNPQIDTAGAVPEFRSRIREIRKGDRKMAAISSIVPLAVATAKKLARIAYSTCLSTVSQGRICRP